MRIDVGDNSAVPARLRNILEAHPETASSSPGSLRSAFAFVGGFGVRSGGRFVCPVCLTTSRLQASENHADKPEDEH